MLTALILLLCFAKANFWFGEELWNANISGGSSKMEHKHLGLVPRIVAYRRKPA